MKRGLLILLLLTFGALWVGEVKVEAEEILDEPSWSVDKPLTGYPFLTSTYDGTYLSITYRGTKPLQCTLRGYGPGFIEDITANRYAIVGKVKYSNIPAGSYVEMCSYFAKGGIEVAADSSPKVTIEGTNDEQDFALPFDATGMKTKLLKLEWNLHLTGPGKVRLWNAKLVQYPNGMLPATQAPPTQASVVPMPASQIPISTTSSNFGVDTSGVPLGQMVGDFPWTQADVMDKGGFPCPPFYPSNPGPLARVEYSKLAEEPDHFELNVMYSGSAPYPMQLLNLSEDIVRNIKTKHYAFVGDVRYENVSPGSYLEMWSYFGSPFPRAYPEAGAYFSRTLAENGPMGKLEGTHDWRAFWLPFDSTGATSTLKNVVLNLQMTGTGTVHLRKIRLVQYPHDSLIATHVTPTRVPVIAAANSGGIDWRSFLLGVFTTGLALLSAKTIIFLLQRWQRKLHERELRRIASLDS
jgi:hypothetical protein